MASEHYVHARAVASNSVKSEDAAEVFERDEKLVVVLGDGAGGMRGSAAASAFLVEAVRSAVHDRAFPVDDLQKWVDLFLAVDAGLVANGAGQTTGIVIVAGPHRLFGISTGHSQAWVVTPSRVFDLTVGQQTKQRLGSKRVTPATFERYALDGGLGVATDGLFNFAANDVIARIVRESDVPTAAEHLVDLVRLRSGKLADDVAVVLVRPVVPAPS
jgi:serine/threonine protein phosphatase PrpC